MPDVSIEFFALPEEIVQFVHGWGGSNDLYIVSSASMTRWDPQVVPINDFSIKQLIGINFTQVFVCLGRPHEFGAGSLSFGECNPECLYLLVGQLHPEGLTVSRLAIRTELPQVLEACKSFKKYIAKRCQAGLWSRLETTKATSFIRRFHYSSGSKQFLDSGGTLFGMLRNQTFSIEPFNDRKS